MPKLRRVRVELEFDTTLSREKLREKGEWAVSVLQKEAKVCDFSDRYKEIVRDIEVSVNTSEPRRRRRA